MGPRGCLMTSEEDRRPARRRRIRTNTTTTGEEAAILPRKTHERELDALTLPVLATEARRVPPTKVPCGVLTFDVA